MKRKIAFLDRDGTINVDKGYLYRREEFEFTTGAVDALKLLTDSGYLIVICSNQSGIARGYYAEDDYHQLNHWLLEQLAIEGIKIAGAYYCPHLPEAPLAAYRVDCECRKPKIGLFKLAIKNLDRQYRLDLVGSVAIGDKMRDLSICREIGCSGYLIGYNESTDIIKNVQDQVNSHLRWAPDLQAAIDLVLRK